MTLQELTPYLDDLEERIDEAEETSLLHEWVEFTEGRCGEPQFAPQRSVRRPPNLEWPPVSLNSTLTDPLLMLYQQLSVNSRILAAGTGELLSIRANFGTPILPSMYGVRLYLMPEETNTLPTCYPLPGGLDAVLRLLEKGAPDLTAGLAPAVLEAGGLFRSVLGKRPRLARHITIYHPDLQGPMDACELLLGSALFTDLIDRPEDVRAVLQSITGTYSTFMWRWLKIVPPMERWSVHWHMLHRGRIMLRDDSATNLSPAMFEEFIKPYDRELLGAFGGGAIHFCGKGDGFIQVAADIPFLYAIHMSQPELNDLEEVCRQTVDRGIHIIGLKREAGQQLAQLGGLPKGCVHCWDGIPK